VKIKSEDDEFGVTEGDWRQLEEGFIFLPPHHWNTERYAKLVNETLRGRSLFITHDGFMGIGPDDMKEGDMVAVFFGGRTPFIIRATSQAKQWSLIGDRHVHGPVLPIVGQS
jgi:hypothetical protein